MKKLPPNSPLGEFFPQRVNLLEPREEKWRPPIFRRPGGLWSDTLALLRRFFDLQAGSIWNDLASLLPHISGDVLDAGCGAQPYRKLFPSTANYRGIDFIHAQSRFGYQAPDTTYYQGDVLPIASHSCDLILATETLEHVLDPPTFLSEARRCLRAGGWLVLTMPFAARWHFIPYDYWRMTPSGIDHLLRSSGFGETRVFARGNAGTVACYKVMAILLPLLLPSSASVFVRWISRLAAVPCIPVLILLAAAGNLTLRASGGDDCLGYTVLAQRGID